MPTMTVTAKNTLATILQHSPKPAWSLSRPQSWRSCVLTRHAIAFQGMICVTAEQRAQRALAS
eukprot:12880353-Prorocentrum_lima.AAC.1